MIICGTNAGYSKHYANKENACDACVEANKAYRKAWREKNKSSILESRRKYRESNKDAINAKSLEWRNANKELANKMTREWQLANVDKHREYILEIKKHVLNGDEKEIQDYIALMFFFMDLDNENRKVNKQDIKMIEDRLNYLIKVI